MQVLELELTTIKGLYRGIRLPPSTTIASRRCRSHEIMVGHCAFSYMLALGNGGSGAGVSSPCCCPCARYHDLNELAEAVGILPTDDRLRPALILGLNAGLASSHIIYA